MKRSKRLYMLFIIFCVTCVATFAVSQVEANKEQIKTIGDIVLEVSSEDIQSLNWECGDVSFTFHKDERWVYDADETFPVDDEKIDSMLALFEAFGVSFIIEEVTDYSMYGLDNPECTINFATNEQSYTVTLGDFSNMDSERYVSIGDGNVYLAKVDPLETFDVGLNDLIRHDEALSYDQISQIQFEGDENYTVFYSEENIAAYCADDVYYTEKNGKTLPLDTYRVERWLGLLETLNLTEYVTYHATEAELAAFNLVDPELSVTVEYTTEGEKGEEIIDTFVLFISRNPEELAAAEKAEENDEEAEEVSAYIRIGESQIVYKISEYDSDNLRAVSYNELRHYEVIPEDFENIYQIDVILEGSEYILSTAGKKDGKRIWHYREEEIEIDDLEYGLKTLSVENADDFISDEPIGKEEIRLTVYLDNENHPKIEIALYRHDGKNCLAVVNDESFALVPRSDVVDLIEAVNAIVLE